MVDHDTDRNREQWGGAAVAPRGVTTAGVTFRLIPLLDQQLAPTLAPRSSVKRHAGWSIDLLVIIGFIVLAVLTTWPLARHPASTLPDLGDPLDSAWRLTWPVQQVLHDPRHLLDANTYYPFANTYLFDELILGVAIVVAPVTLLTKNGVLAFNVALLIAFAMNGIGMYALGRHLTGNRLAAIAGGLVFAFAPFRFQHLGHIGLSTAFWLPLTLLFLDRTVLRPRWRDALAFGVCAAMQALSAQYYGFQVVLVVGLYLLWAAWRRRAWLFAGRCLIRLLVAVLLAEALLVPIVAPYLAVKGAWGYSRGLEENELHSATLSSFLAVPPGNLLAAQLTAPLRRMLHIQSWSVWLYPGLGALLIGLAGLCRPRRWWRHAPGSQAASNGGPPDLYGYLLLVALFGAVMALGPSLYWQTIDPAHVLTRLMPYRLVFFLIPGFDAMRAPERFGNLLLLGLAGMVSFGSTSLLARGTWLPGPRFVRRLGRAALHVGTGFLLLIVVGAEYLHQPLRPVVVPTPPAVYTWLAVQPTGPVLELPLTIPADELNREQVRQYWSTFHWQPRVNGSSDIAPRAYQALRRDLEQFPDPRTMGLLQGLGVRYVIIHRGQYAADARAALLLRVNASAPVLQPAGEFGDDRVYTIAPDVRYAALRQQIPIAADILLADADPAGTDAYMAMLGWVLRASSLHSRIVPTFGPRYLHIDPEALPAWVICYRGESPATYGYPANLPIVYEDAIVRVYHDNRVQ